MSSHRVNQANQGSQEVQDSKELQDHLVSQVYQEDQVPKATPASQDSKVNLTFDYNRFGKEPQKPKNIFDVIDLYY